MKTWKLIGMMLLLAAGVVACNDETEEDPGGNGSGDTPEVPVVTPEDTVVLTVQMRAGAQNFPWREADSLSVLADTANWLFVTTTGGSPATFYGPAAEADVYYGLYPYQKEASLDNSSGALRLMAELPAEQRAVAGGYDYKLNMAAGVATDGGAMICKLLNGYLKFNLTNCRGEVAEITMTGTSGLAGALTIDAEDRSVVSAEGTSVTLAAPEGGVFDRSVDYYLVVAPGTLEGVTFTFYDQEGNPYTSEVGTLAVTAGDVFDLTSVENFVPSDLAWGVTYDENYAHRFVDMIQYLDETDARTYGFNIGTTVLSEEGWAMFQELADEWCAGLTTDYEKAETSPPGMLNSPLYPKPVSLAYMTRLLPDSPSEVPQLLPDAKQFVQICSKVAGYDLGSSDINETRFLGRRILDPSTMIQRLFVLWANGVRYSYPGTCEDPDSDAFKRRWSSGADLKGHRKIIWSAPYKASQDALRITCRYPMYGRDGRFLGVAGLELRLERLLDPLIRAHDADSIHELYLLDREGCVVTVRNGKLILLGETPANGLPAAGEVRALADTLAAGNMEQFERHVGGKNYFASGYRIRTTDAVLIQMIEENAMAHHDHRDITL